MKDKSISKSSKKEQSNYLAAIKDVEQKIENKFQDLWNRYFHHDNLPDVFSYSALGNMPKMDVIDRDKEIFVKAELPGIDKKDLEISITNNQLVIKAKTCHEEKEEKGDYLRQEISKSELYRSVLLPGDVDVDKVKTSFKNGVLKITLPKQKSSYRKRIEVK
jgi:HSP20 family protein